MTDCDAKSFIQRQKMAVLRCLDPCTKKSFITFKEDRLKKQISKLRSSTSNKLVEDTFADLFDGVESLTSMEFLQLDAQVEPVINLTDFNNPPVPRTKVPSNPCNDRHGGAPSAATKRAAKCTITKSPQCYKLQERFLLIQAGIKDDRDALLEDIASMEKHCEETKNTLEKQIADDEEMLSDAQTKWDPEECTKTCRREGQFSGEQKLTRSVLTHPNGGAKCLPLAAIKKCNQHPCPVDCKVGVWSGWSKCSAE